MSQPMRVVWRCLAIGALSLGLLAGGCRRQAQEPMPPPEPAQAPSPASAAVPQQERDWLDSYSRASIAVAQAVSPSVAFVSVQRTAAAGAPSQFLPGQMLPPNRQRAEGSAVVIDPAGVLLTNNHVVERAT